MYTLDVSFDLNASVIKGVARIPAARDRELRLHRGRLTLTRVSLDKGEVAVSNEGEWVRIRPSREGTVEIRYEGLFRGSGDDEQPGAVIGAGGIFLDGPWYPKPEGLCEYRLTVRLPAGYEAVSEGETVEKTAVEGGTRFAFFFPHPLEGMTLIATDRYRVTRERVAGVEVFAYFFPEDSDLVKTYLERTKGYLTLYGSLIGPFPYKRFSVVENFLPTGYSMPTYTLLGQAVVRLPFIPETSLGHEILHQWLGNLVFIDYEKGNWAEGLTTFLADHLYEEEKGRGAEYRKDALAAYMSYVNGKNEFPLKAFVERTDRASEAIGYGKAVMVFQMLRDLVGKERFNASVRSFCREMAFKEASWADIERVFQAHSQGDLGWFFRQWIERKGLADLRLGEADAEPSGSRFKVSFEVLQGKEPFVLDIPVAVYARGGTTRKTFRLSGERGQFEMMVDGLPQRVVLDDNYDLARRLSPDEFPPTIARLLGEEKRAILLPSASAGIYEEVVRAFTARGDEAIPPARATFDMLKGHSLVILGAKNPVVGRLYGSAGGGGGFSVLVRNNPWNPRKVVAIVDASSADEVKEAFPKVSHYGKYSFLSFDHGVNTSKRTDESAKGISASLSKEVKALDISALKTLSYVVERVAGKGIIYVGETHDRFSHHATELEIIRELHRKGKKIIIGMEMFERPFQKVLDDYIEGRVDEGAFLRGTEYYKRWAFDYNLYRPILLFARSERIPVIALNQKREIVDKVFRKGIDSLTEEEKKGLPSMDFSDDAYRERLKQVFLEHGASKGDGFDFFYQAQVLWDETMAESIALALKARPEAQAVVLAGRGHLEYGSGIPKRTARRNGRDYAIILNDVDPEPRIADFVLYPGAVPENSSPMLMVVLKEEGGRVEVTGFPPDSVSEKAGMRKGDVLLAIGKTPINTIDDLKIDLLSRHREDKVKVRVSRKGFFGSSEREFEIALQ